MTATLVATGAVPQMNLGMTPIAKAIQALYGMTVAINEYLDKHIEEMKGAENPTVSRSGRILEMAKFGFGIGYIAPVVIIATGQLLLGFQFQAALTIVTAATLTNPIAMTCAAIGAIYYGWGALSDVEQGEALDKLSKGLEIGVEFVKAVVRFVLEKVKELLSSKNLDEIKTYIASVAETFGKSLSSITHQVSDVVSDGLGTVKRLAGEAIDKTGDAVGKVYDATAEKAQETADGAKEVIKKLRRPGASEASHEKSQVDASPPALPTTTSKIDS